MVEPGVMPVDESLRSSDMGDEEEKKKEEGVHAGDWPAIGTTGNMKSKGREGRRNELAVGRV